MGEARQRKRRFLAAHPCCCFCGGLEPATSVDHIPARTCFVGRAGPEGFEFPACDKCQRASRLDELAFGMFVRFNDPSTDNYEREGIIKAFEGVRNNLPHLLPFPVSDCDKRAALKAKGLTKPSNMLVKDISMVGIPAAIGPYIHRYCRKLAAALYYREKGKPVGPDFALWTHWAQAVDQIQMPGLLEVARMSSFQTVGHRTNLKFGDRFGYRCDKSDDNDLFMAVAQFGKGLVIAMLVADELPAEEMEDGGWVKASAMFD